MIINTHEHIINVRDEFDKLIKTSTSITYMIYPDEGKVLRNTKTGIVYPGNIGIDRKSSIAQYEEVDA